MLLGCESAAAEPFIGGLLMSDNRYELNYPFGTVVPTYAYIYHEYVRKSNELNRNKIVEDFENGKEVVVNAKITGIHGEGARSFALLRFNESGLRGYVDCRDWSTGYTADVRFAAKVGDFIKVKVVEKNKSSLKADFRCSRALALGDPWEGIGEKLHRKDVVNVKIGGKWNGGFSGMIEGFPDITPWVALPDKHEFRLVPGLIYQCEITSLYEESKSMRVRPLRLSFFE